MDDVSRDLCVTPGGLCIFGGKHVLRMIVKQGAKLAAIGVAAGLAAAFGLTRVLGRLLYGVKAADPMTFAGVAVAIGLVALAASYIPAPRAAAVDPNQALRHE